MSKRNLSSRLSAAVLKRQVTIAELCEALGINPLGMTGAVLWDCIIDRYLALVR